MSGCGDPRAVKGLPAVVIHAAEHDQRDPFAFFSEQLFDIFGANGRFARARADFDQRGCRVVTVIADLRLHGVLIGGKSVRFDEDFVSRRRGPVKRNHHQVQIHGERVHHDDFVRAARPPAARWAPPAFRDTASRDFARENGLPRRAWPSLPVPVRCRRARSSAASRENGRRDTRSRRRPGLGDVETIAIAASGSRAFIARAKSRPASNLACRPLRDSPEASGRDESAVSAFCQSRSSIRVIESHNSASRRS